MILAIDPGPTSSGVVVYDPETGKVLFADAKRMNKDVLADIGTFLGGKPYLPQPVIVCEMVASYGMEVGAPIFETVRWVGRFEQHAADRGFESSFQVMYRLEVKMHLCHDSRAKGKNIRRAILDRYLAKGHESAQGTKAKPGPLYGVSDHSWSALALAITWGDKHP